MLTEGQILEGKYRIVRVIGRGGMGTVYAGENSRIRRQVAIKVLHKGVDGEAVRRFEKEAQAAGQIGSDHIVEVLDLGALPSGEHFMVMEFLDGETLKQRLRGQLLTPEQAVPVFLQLLEGLAGAHAARIIHRDLKPENVFLLRQKAGRRDFVKILDFGISKFSSIVDDQGQSTRTGTVLGTPVYMSPEQVKSSHEVDERSDIYSVGVILFQSITGRVPFKAATFHELLFKIVYEAPPHPTVFAPHLDVGFCAIVMKAMAREPDTRYQDARAFASALVAWQESLPARAGGVAAAPPPPEPIRAAPPLDEDEALTEIVPGASSRSGMSPPAASGVLMPGTPLETQQSWAPTHSGPKGTRRGVLFSFALASVAVGASAAWFFLGRGSPVADRAPVATASASAEQAAPVLAAAPAPAPASAEPATSASASSPAPPTQASARAAVPTGRPPRPPPADKPPKPSGTVSDFGY